MTGNAFPEKKLNASYLANSSNYHFHVNYYCRNNIMQIKNLFILFLGLAVSSFSLSAQNKTIKQIGNYKDHIKESNGILINAENAKLRISLYSPRIIRIRVTQDEFQKDFSYAVIQEPQGEFNNIIDDKDKIELSITDAKVIIQKNPIRIKFQDKNGKSLNEDYSEQGITWQGTEVKNHKKLFPDEKFIGLGEKTGNLDRRGNSYTNWNTDHYAYQVDDDPIYQSIPFYMGIHNNSVYGIFMDNSFRSNFNFAASTDDEYSSFSAEDGELNYYFFSSETIADIIKDYTYLTGRMKMPPLWSLGFQQCRWSYFPDKEVLNLAQSFREKKIPADVIYLDIHYMDEYKIFTWNSERFPKPKEMIDKLKEMGFHVAVIVDPGIKIDKNYQSYREGVKNDYFIKYPYGKIYTGSVWPGRCHFPDFSNQKAREWWGNSFTKLIEPGVEGFWNDMNEPAAWGQSFPTTVNMDFDGNKPTMREGHNIYGLQMSRATFEGTKKLLNGKRPLVLTRAGYSGIQRYSAVWTGDNVASEEHMLLASRLLNSLGLSGISFVGADLGGFSGNPTPSLFARWISLAAFTPFFRSHSEYNSNAHEPWAFGESVEEIAKKYIELRYQLIPYIYSAFYESSISGLPVARSLAINYTYDPKVFYYDYQCEYLFGDNLLITPTGSKEKFTKVYLPSGSWYRYSSDEIYEGGKEYIIESPLEDLPVFVKAGGIIPLQSIIQSTSEKPSEIIQLHIYFGKDENKFTYYEDDGSTYDYEKGMYYKRLIEFNPANKEIRFGKPEGSFNSKFTKVRLVLHNFKDLTQISINKKKSQVIELETKTLTKTVEFDNSKEEIVINY
jgi:alpha-glucosidase